MEKRDYCTYKVALNIGIKILPSSSGDHAYTDDRGGTFVKVRSKVNDKSTEVR